MDQDVDVAAVTSTKTLCRHLAAAQFGDLSPAAVHEARRGVLDWLGCALAGSGHKTITTLLEGLRETGGRPPATPSGGGGKNPRPPAPPRHRPRGPRPPFAQPHMRRGARPA